MTGPSEAAPASVAAHNDPQKDDDGEEGTSVHQHRGWEARGHFSAATSGSSAHGGSRFPLKEAPVNGVDERKIERQVGGNSNRRQQYPRSYEIPNASNMRRPTVACEKKKVLPEAEGNGMTLRCMYTSQKTKKRKTWSDGAVKCCPRRQRVSLYRWSEALGVTDKLLGEIYLTMPQYQAFVTQGEPELEMEMFIVSLEGVIQPGSDPPAGTDTASASGAPVDRSDGTAIVGRKRKLFKAFKPPARRAPLTAPSPDDTTGLPPGRMDQPWHGDRSGDQRRGSGSGIGGRGTMPPRTTYTGFGHVESLSDDDGEQDLRADHAGHVGLAGEGDRGWGTMARTDYRSGYGGNAYGEGRASMYPDFLSETVPKQPQGGLQSSSGPAGGSVASDHKWAQEDIPQVHDGGSGGSAPPPSSRSTSGVDRAFHSAVQRQRQLQSSCYEDLTFDSRDTPSSRLESHSSGDRARGTHRDTAARSERGRGAQGVHGAVGHGKRDREHHRYDGLDHAMGAGAAVRDEPFGCSVASAREGGMRVPEHDREPTGCDNVSRDETLRSTQDILSLFGDGSGGTPSPRADVRDHGFHAPQDNRETTLSSLLDSRGPGDATRETGATGGAYVPAGGGISKAADMRRAEKAALTAARAAATTGQAAAQSDGTEEGGKASVTKDSVFTSEWACGVCGVRAEASSTSCRVCGAKRQAPSSGHFGCGGDVDPTGAGDSMGDSAPADASEEQRRWGSGGYHETGEWESEVWATESTEANDIEHTENGRLRDGNDGIVDGSNIGFDGPTTASPEGHGSRPRVLSGSPSRASFSPNLLKRDEVGKEGVATSSASVARSKHLAAGVRMQMDMGSSSDSDNAQ